MGVSVDIFETYSRDISDKRPVDTPACLGM